MTETYTSLGAPADWRFYVPTGALFAASPWLLRGFAKRVGGSINPMHWGICAWGVWQIVGSLLHVPQIAMSGSMPIFIALSMIAPWPAESAKKMPIWARGVFFLVLVALGWFTASIGFGDSRVILRDQDGSFQKPSSKRLRSLPRTGLEVDSAQSVTDGQPYRGGALWTVMYHDSPFTIIWGKDLYWGPHGMVQGDQVGQRIATWANVKPKYETY
jgi:hypothetical protein